MKKHFAAAAAFWLASFLFAFVFVATGWAEGPLRSNYKIGTPYDTPAPFKWAGAYVGAGIGWQWADIDWQCGDCPAHNARDDFWIGDLKAGFDIGFGNSPFGVGVFATWSPEFLIGREGVDNIYTVGGRLNYVPPSLPDTMVYVGGAWVRAEGSIGSNSITADGWAVLAGFEKKLVSNIVWGVEYNYTELGADFENCTADLTGHAVKFRTGIRF